MVVPCLKFMELACWVYSRSVWTCIIYYLRKNIWWWRTLLLRMILLYPHTAKVSLYEWIWQKLDPTSISFSNLKNTWHSISIPTQPNNHFNRAVLWTNGSLFFETIEIVTYPMFLPRLLKYVGTYWLWDIRKYISMVDIRQ